MQFVSNANAVLVHTSCAHTDTRYDRFGDEVCASCGATIEAGIVPPNEGLESCSSYRPPLSTVLSWQYVHKGYYHAVSDMTGDSFVVRTRPRNDGWMAIHEDDSIVMATGLSLYHAKQLCQKVDTTNTHPTF